jgi:hypothetical protein
MAVNSENLRKQIQEILQKRAREITALTHVCNKGGRLTKEIMIRETRRIQIPELE